MTTPNLLDVLDAPQRRRKTNRGKRYAPDPYRMDELQALLRAARQPWQPGPTALLAGEQRYALYILLWRTGLRISESLRLEERDLDQDRRTVLVRRGKGGKRRTVMMDDWAWSQIQPWREARKQMPYGSLFCTLLQPNAGAPISACDARRSMRQAGQQACLRRRCHPHAFRHTHTIDLWREGIDVYAIMTQLGHARLDITAAYLRAMGADEILKPIGLRPAPMVAFAL